MKFEPPTPWPRSPRAPQCPAAPAPAGGQGSPPRRRMRTRKPAMAQLSEARVPDIGGSTNVPVIEVLVQVGDTVRKDLGLVTLESDKATMEVPAPFAGVVRELKLKVGDEVGEGALVAMIEVGEAASATAAPATAAASSKTPVAEPSPQPSPGGGGSKGTEPDVTVRDSAREPAQDATLAEATGKPATAPDAPTPSSPLPSAQLSPPVAFDADQLLPDKVPYASPAVRVFARELGVDLGKVKGSERGGRITKADVQGFVKQTLAAPAGGGVQIGGGLNLIPWPKVDFARFGPVETQPLSRIKKLSGANLARNWAMIPHVTQNDAADITEMEAFRKQLGEEHKDTKVTPLVFLIKAVVAGLKKYPQFNASLDGEQLVLKQYFHVGIAVDTPDGLVVPVIRDCDRKGLLELAAELGAISTRARDRKLGPADMSGGCFSISSLGGIGGTGFTPIINAPEVAILGVSKSSMQPVWNGKEFAPRLMLPLSLSYDHRVIDGAAAARFTAFLAQVLGDLRRLLV
ncbi:MAG: dihydrolipoyllysine-residue acetyltransferase [Arenimonas sp.]